jgi:asparagine synthase (glutamine-hydrolysing)
LGEKGSLDMGAIVAVIDKRGKNATEAAVAMLKILEHKGIEAFGIASAKHVVIEKSTEALQSKNINSSVVVGHAFYRTIRTDKPQPVKLENATLVFEGRIYPTKSEISASEIFAQKHWQKEAIKNLFASEGFFAFAIARREEIIAGRDTMGIHPLHYGENFEFGALAPERKALWRIGIKGVNSFPPGHVALVNRKGFQFKPVRTLTYSRAKPTTMQVAVKQLQKLLLQSVNERVSGLREVAVAFSGGLDSGLIAFLAKNSGADVHLVHVGLKNHLETEYAKKVAEELKLPIHVHLYNEEDVEKILLRVLWLIEESDPVKASIGVPFYWTAEKTAEMSFKVMLAGQGADELFGGYKRYIDDYLRYGSEKTREILFRDVLKMYETNFERDFKICSFHDVELRLPFATYQIAKFASNLPVELKIKLPDDGLRKLVLRRAAENLGLPQLVAEKPKKAIQYATGISKVLKKLARKNKLSMNEYMQRIFQKVLKMMEYE